MENKIREWLEKSGYPLELSAVEILNKRDYKPSPSNLYQDYETDKIREIDIIAHKTIDNSRIFVESKFVIECKKSNKPFILLTHNNDTCFVTKIFLNGEPDDPTAPSAIDTSINVDNYKKVMDFDWSKYSIGYKIIQGFTDSDDTVYTAINSIAKSFKYFIESDRQAYDMYIKDNYYSISIPVFLIDAPLYKTFFDTNNILQIEKIDFAFISIKKPWEFEMDSKYYVPIITLDYFDNFINEVDSLMKLYLANIKVMPAKYQIRNLHKRKKGKQADTRKSKQIK